MTTRGERNAILDARYVWRNLLPDEQELLVACADGPPSEHAPKPRFNLMTLGLINGDMTIRNLGRYVLRWGRT